MSDHLVGKAFDDLWAKSSERNWIYGRLGQGDGSGGYVFDVVGQPGYKYVMKGSAGDEGLVTALDRVGASNVGNQHVKMRREFGHLVIREAEVLAAVGGSTTLASLTDVDITTPLDGQTLFYDDTTAKWFNDTASSGSGLAAHVLNGVYHTGTLDDAQAPQFLLLDGSRALTGNLAVSAGVTIDGVDLGAFKAAYNAHIADPDAHHYHATSANSAITIGGTQIVSLVLATGSGLAISSGLKVDVAHDFAWTGDHTFSTDVVTFNTAPQINANLAFVGGDRVITASGDLTFTPVDDLILTSTKTYRSSDYADGIPIAGFSQFINSGGHRQLTTHTIKADELHVRVFIADTVRVDVGEEYWGKSMGIVYADFTTPASIGSTVTVTFEDSVALSGAIFASGDWIMISTVDIGTGLEVNQIWGQVSDYSSLGADVNGVGRQSWTFTLRSGPTSWPVKKGRLAVDFGVSGQGYVHLSTLDSADGPWIQIGTWSGANPYTAGNRTIRAQMGHLDGLSDAALNPSGYGFYSDNAFLHGVVRTAESLMDDEGMAFEIQTLDGTIITSTSDFSRLAWWDDLGTRTGTPKIDLTGYIDSSGALEVGKTFNRLDIDVSSSGADAGLITLLTAGASVRVDSRGTVTLGGTVSHIGDDLPAIDVTYNLGSASKRWSTIYADNLVISTSISGASIGGQTWTYPGSMVIDATGSGTRTVSITNSGVGSANLDVDQDITLGGTVDGVDVGAFYANFGAHITDADAHHNHATAGSGIVVGAITQVVSVDGTVVRTGRTITAGAGLAGGGDLSADRTIAVNLASPSGLTTTGGLQIADSLAGDGLSIVSKVLQVDGTVVRITRTISTSGALAGGGDLSANRTLSLTLATNSALNQTSGLAVDSSIAGTGLTMTSGVLNVIALSTGGLTVNANDIQINLPSPSGLTADATGLYIADSIAGAGLTITSKVLAVGAGTGITVAANDVAVNQATNFAWTGNSTFAGSSTFNGNIVFNHDISITGARTITSDSTNNLTLAPGGSLVLSPTGNTILPTSSYQVDLGAYNRKFKTLYIGELYTENLVAQSVMATIGGRVMVAPTNVLVADLSSVATTINVKYNNFVNGSYIMFESAPGGVPQFEVMKVTSAVSGTAGNYTYTVSRNQDGTGANAWVIGDACVDWGSAVGQGYIDLTSTTTALGSHAGPTITTYARTSTAAWNNIKPTVSMGNLNGFVDYASDEYGFAVGADLTLGVSTFAGLTVDRTSGLRMFNTTSQWRNGGNTYTMGITGGNLKISANATLGVADVMTISTTQTLFNQDMQVLGAIYSGAGGLDFSLGSGTTGVILADSTVSGAGDGGLGGAVMTAGPFRVYKNDTDTGRKSGLMVEQDSTGDAALVLGLTAGQYYSIGIDNSDSDKLKISRSDTLGTSDVLSIDTAGDVTLTGALNAPGGVRGGSTGNMATNTAIALAVPGGHATLVIYPFTGGTSGYTAMVRVRADSSPSTIGFFTGANVAYTTGVLTGTTGAASTLTISPHTDGNVYIENRRGITVQWQYTWI